MLIRALGLTGRTIDWFVLRHGVAEWHGAGDWFAVRAAISVEAAWGLGFDLWLMIHVRENLKRRLGGFLTTETGHTHYEHNQ